MKLHETLVQKLLKVYEVNSGWSEEYKLLNALRNLDFSVYTQTNGNKVLVETAELNAVLKQFEAIDQRQERIAKMVEDAKRMNNKE